MSYNRVVVLSFDVITVQLCCPLMSYNRVVVLFFDVITAIVLSFDVL